MEKLKVDCRTFHNCCCWDHGWTLSKILTLGTRIHLSKKRLPIMDCHKNTLHHRNILVAEMLLGLNIKAPRLQIWEILTWKLLGFIKTYLCNFFKLWISFPWVQKFCCQSVLEWVPSTPPHRPIHLLHRRYAYLAPGVAVLNNTRGIVKLLGGN